MIRCGILRCVPVCTLVLAILGMPARLPAALVEASQTGDRISLARSLAQIGNCSESDAPELCFKARFDPPFLEEALLTLRVSPAERAGDVFRVTYFNGYGPNGRLDSRVEGDAFVLNIPVTSLSPPAAGVRGDIVEIEFLDGSPGTGRVDFDFLASSVLVNPGDGGSSFPIPADRIDPGDTTIFIVDLDPQQVVPTPDVGSASPTGTAMASFSLANDNRFEVAGNYRGLSGGFTGVGLYGPAGPGEIGPQILGFAMSGNPNDTTGSFSFSGMLDPDETQALLSGKTYLQVTSITNPPGEIRGQLVPEPSSLLLSLLGLLALGMTRRSQYRSSLAK